MIVHWNVRVEQGLSPLPQQLGVFRPINGGTEYAKVAESTTETFGPETEAFPTRIPVQAGDFLGLYGPLGTFVCDGQEGGTAAALLEGNIGLGEAKAFKSESGVRAPVIAVVESDLDGDGYGDASQDGCPESAVFQTNCPFVALDIGKVTVRRDAILIEVSNNTDASVEARGEVHWSTSSKNNSAAHPPQEGRVRVGLTSERAKTVTVGTTVTVRVPLPRAVLQKLGRLGPRQALRARIDVIGTNSVPYTGTHELKVRLPGRARPKQSR